jgi:hypothetical protein
VSGVVGKRSKFEMLLPFAMPVAPARPTDHADDRFRTLQPATRKPASPHTTHLTTTHLRVSAVDHRSRRKRTTTEASEASSGQGREAGNLG